MKAENRRRYPRVFLNQSLGDFNELLGIQVKWPHDDVGGVLDISYVGAALSRPAGLNIPLTPNELIPLEFHFSDKSIKINAYFIREIEHAVGVSFPELSTEAHMELEKFLKEKMIGLSTHYIKPEFYSKNQDFSHWYHGPNDTNIFIWEDDQRIYKATIEFGLNVLLYEDEKISYLKVSPWLNDMDDDYAYYTRNGVKQETIQNTHVFYDKVISILSQINENRKTTDKLLNILKNFKP